MKQVNVYTDGKGPYKVYGGCGYYRIVQPSKFLGIDVRKDFWSSFYVTVEECIEKLYTEYDLCHMQRIENPEMVCGLIAGRDMYNQMGRNVKLIIDMDDDFINVSNDNPARKVYDGKSKGWQCVKVLLTEADGLTVSTDKLAELYSQFNSNIEVFPNLMDKDIWKFENKKHDDDILRIGWTGGNSHHSDLKWFTPVIKAITDKYPNVRFSVMGYMPVEWIDFDIIRGDSVTNADYPMGLAEQGYDIGIAPLEDTEFNQAKSPIKHFEYSMLRIPSVCQKGEHLPYQNNGIENETIVTAGSVDEWISALSMLIEDETKRKLIGNNSYDYVTKHFSADRDTERRKQFYRDTYDGKRVNKYIGTEFGVFSKCS